MIGADIAQMGELERTFRAEAEKVRGAVTSIGGRVNSTQWVGADADKFRNEWESTHARTLSQAADALEQIAGVVKNQADAQTSTSSA
jgi:hypothetical protein